MKKIGITMLLLLGLSIGTNSIEAGKGGAIAGGIIGGAALGGLIGASASRGGCCGGYYGYYGPYDPFYGPYAYGPYAYGPAYYYGPGPLWYR